MPKILFLTLRIFSATGGIEKMNRIIGMALFDSGYGLKIFSSHDKEKCHNKYFPSATLSVFNADKIRFTLKSIREGIKNNIVIISHINLLTIGYFIKILSPRTKLILFAHGIEIWKPLSSFKKKMLSKCDRVFSVSHFTADTIKQRAYVTDKQSVVLNNCLDPFIKKENPGIKSTGLLSRYGLTESNFILLTVTRLNSEEKYKGYDIVLKSLQRLIKKYPQLHYVIVGKYDTSEKERVDKMISSMSLAHAVTITGYIPDEELQTHYHLADLYIMPSAGEGFGIVFIEAMFYGLPVVAGNKDGSVDALLNGKLGQLVDPGSVEEIMLAIEKVINNRQDFIPDNNLLMQTFSYSGYKSNLQELIKKLAY